jgi:hypothetical protein
MREWFFEEKHAQLFPILFEYVLRGFEVTLSRQYSETASNDPIIKRYKYELENPEEIINVRKEIYITSLNSTSPLNNVSIIKNKGAVKIVHFLHVREIKDKEGNYIVLKNTESLTPGNFYLDLVTNQIKQTDEGITYIPNLSKYIRPVKILNILSSPPRTSSKQSALVCEEDSDFCLNVIGRKTREYQQAFQYNKENMRALYYSFSNYYKKLFKYTKVGDYRIIISNHDKDLTIDEFLKADLYGRHHSYYFRVDMLEQLFKQKYTSEGRKVWVMDNVYDALSQISLHDIKRIPKAILE